MFVSKSEDAKVAFYQAQTKSTIPPGATGLTAFQSTFYPFAQKNCISCHGVSQTPLIAVSNVSSAYSVAKDPSYMNFASVSLSKLATKSGDGHCGNAGCSGSSKDAAIAQLKAWADIENAIAAATPVGGTPAGGGGPIVTGGPATGGAGATAFISQPLALPLPLPSGNTYKVMRWQLSQLTPASALTNGAVFEIEVQQLSSTTYRVRNPRIIGLRSVIRVSGMHILVKPSGDPGFGVEDLGAGSVWENTSANAPVSTLPATLPVGPIVTTPAVPALDTFANIIGVRSNQDSFTIAFDKIETSAALTNTFASINQYIIAPRCIGCHNAGNPAGGVRYDNYASATAANSVNRGTPNQSRLYVTSLGNNASMTVQKGQTALTAAESAVILSWITAGALNN